MDNDWREWAASLVQLGQDGPGKPNDYNSLMKRAYYQRLLQFFLSELMRAVTKGVVHKNTGSRKVSRLAARLKKLSAA